MSLSISTTINEKNCRKERMSSIYFKLQKNNKHDYPAMVLLLFLFSTEWNYYTLNNNNIVKNDLQINNLTHCGPDNKKVHKTLPNRCVEKME